MHWLDPGNGAKRGAFPLDVDAVKKLAVLSREKGIQICTQMTSFQLENQYRPWIRQERAVFLEQLRKEGLGDDLVRSVSSRGRGTICEHFAVLKGS